jgi:hypothetical protein
MIIVGKHINNVTISPLEYLLDDDGKVMKFINEDAAKAFLKEKSLSDDDIYGLVFETVSASSMTKEVFMDAKASISKIEDLLNEAADLLDRIPPVIQQAIFDYHNETGTMQHCLRYGIQAAKELREDWHTVLADISVECEGCGTK